jgi:hypothetical protein
MVFKGIKCVEKGHVKVFFSHAGKYIISNIVANINDTYKNKQLFLYNNNNDIHTSNDCESPSDSDNIVTRVKAKYSKARQKKIHKKSQKSNTRRRNNIYNQTCKKQKKNKKT